MKNAPATQEDASSRSCASPLPKARSGLAAFLLALCAVFLLYSVLPDETLWQNLILTALLAAVSFGAVAVSFPMALKPLSVKPFRSLVLWVLGVGFVGGLELLALNGLAAGVEPSSVAFLLVPTVLLCLLTGVFEEGFFRVLLMNALVEYGPAAKRPWLAAAALSSLLFALLHVPIGALSGDDAPALIQALLKLMQTGAFGMIMAGLYAAKKNLWLCALIHGVFNAFYVGPVFLGAVVPTTYLPGSMDDMVVLASTLFLLIPPAVILWRKLLIKQ